MKKLIKPALYLLLLLIAWPASKGEPWNEIMSQMVVVISVITAAVFLRLTRPIPKMKSTHFKYKSIQRIGNSYLAVSKQMAAFGYTIIITLGYAILALKPLESFLAVNCTFSSLPRYFLCLMFGHILIRSFSLISRDLEFANLQAEIACEENKKTEDEK